MLAQMFRAAQSGLSATVAGEVRLALEAADIPSFWRSNQQIQNELRRCRRYEHSMSLLVLDVDGASLHRAAVEHGRAPADADAWFMRRFECTALLLLGWILRDGTRESDFLSYVADRDLYALILPEADSYAAQEAARRLSDLFEQRSTLTVRRGIATFPEEGLTVEALFQHACAALRAPKATLPSRNEQKVEQPVASTSGAKIVRARESLIETQVRRVSNG